MDHYTDFLPRQVNRGNFVTGYSFTELQDRIVGSRVVLPICSLGTAPAELSELGSLVLPPLYHEALTDELKQRIVGRIRACFPYIEGISKRHTWQGVLEVVELPRRPWPKAPSPALLAFSVDTAVEEHGPHLPLATDTIQSYAVLQQLAAENPEMLIGPPVDYGMLTWGLAFGLSIDLTAQLTTDYVTRFTNAVIDWLHPRAIYVVDVHGSMIHRQAVQSGLQASRSGCHRFRWLYDPLAEFTADRNDFHAGGVETALIERINPQLVDQRWWPGRIDELAAGELAVPTAVHLSADLPRFIDHVQSQPLNGIIGQIRNYADLDATVLWQRMCAVGRTDVQQLLEQARPLNSRSESGAVGR